MTDNMEVVAECLGVTLGKAFYIKDRPHSYIIIKTGLFKIVNNIQTKIEDDTLELLLLGRLEIDQRFLPMKGELYFVPILTGVEGLHWENNDRDRYFFDNNLVYDTYEKAKELFDMFMTDAKGYNNEGKKAKRNP